MKLPRKIKQAKRYQRMFFLSGLILEGKASLAEMKEFQRLRFLEKGRFNHKMIQKKG